MRSDGDVHYIYPPDAHGFSLYRRALSSTGMLGPEQRITASEVGEPSKLKAVRTASGRIIVAFSDIAELGPQGEPKVPSKQESRPPSAGVGARSHRTLLPSTTSVQLLRPPPARHQVT